MVSCRNSNNEEQVRRNSAGECNSHSWTRHREMLEVQFVEGARHMLRGRLYMQESFSGVLSHPAVASSTFHCKRRYARGYCAYIKTALPQQKNKRVETNYKKKTEGNRLRKFYHLFQTEKKETLQQQQEET